MSQRGGRGPSGGQAAGAQQPPQPEFQGRVKLWEKEWQPLVQPNIYAYEKNDSDVKFRKWTALGAGCAQIVAIAGMAADRACGGRRGCLPPPSTRTLPSPPPPPPPAPLLPRPTDAPCLPTCLQVCGASTWVDPATLTSSR